VADPQQVEKRGSYRETRETNEHDGYNGVPDKGHVAPKCRYDVLPIYQSLTLPEELPRTAANLHARGSSGP
jgi:hypothetical protein